MIFTNYLIKWQYFKAACFSEGIWKAIVWLIKFWNYLFEWGKLEESYLKTLFVNYFFQSWYLGTNFFEWCYFKSTCLNNNIWKLLVWKTVFGNQLFETQYLESASLNEIIRKLLVRMKAFGNYFSEDGI